ncbi:MAG: TIR domain-containing protein [Candidatus Brocadiaceae bacterium]|nr:TIR domain-containing protein [Candidatus Brocadiaceae bacterium]
MQQSTARFAIDVIKKEMSERSGKLIISDCGITEIPIDVFEMSWLTELIISNGYDQDTNLNLKNTSDIQNPNYLTYIPEQIVNLRRLERLHLGPFGTSSWSIDDIGVLSALTELEELNLSNNQITDISPLRNLVNLKSLNLDYNQISDISSLRSLVSLKFLNFNYNQISEISELAELVELQELFLESNQISDIEIFKRLVNLRKLNLSGNNVFNIETVGCITGLQELYLSSNKIDYIGSLKSLNELEILHCSNNQIKEIESLSNLSNLRELFIEENDIYEIEPIINICNLSTLRLDKNPIKDCPPDVWQTGDIEQIRAHFEGQTRDDAFRIEQQARQGHLEQLEKEREVLNLELDNQKTLKQEKKKIRQKLEKTEKALEQQKKQIDGLEISDVKLIFVGNSGVGKTQLSKYFETGKLNYERESTHGIRLKRWLPDGNVSTALANLKEEVAANIWDFGGQEYYHGTFRLFLSNYAIYVLMWEKDTNLNDTLSTEVRKDETEDLQHYNYKYWLDNVRHYAPDSPIIILQNKVDKHKRERVNTECINDYDIFADHYISLHEAVKEKSQQYKWNFDLFCNDLSLCMQSILAEKANQQKSIAWLQVRDAVVDVTKGGKKSDDNPFIPFLKTGKYIKIRDFNEACLEIESELTESELYTLPRWLHNSGLVIYFSEDKTLNDRVYLDPSWVTEGIYKILNDTVRAKKGVFTKEDMKSRSGFRKDTVLSLMKQMEIIFEKMDETGNVSGTFVAPQYLPETHPVEDLYAIAAKGLQQKAFFIRLPLYFFRKVLQRMIFFYGMSKGVDARYYWKKGILFEKRGTRVMFKGILPVAESEQGVFLIGAEPVGDYFEVQKEVFHIISEILEEKELSKIVGSSDSKASSGPYHSRPENWTASYETESTPRWLSHLEVSVDGRNFVKYLDLCNDNRNNLVFIQSNLMERLRIHDFEVLLDSKPQRPLKIFFSYSHKDTDIMNRLSVHLAPLRRLEKIEVWTDKAIQAGEEWDAEIEKNLRDSNIILLLVSADFVASSYIWEKEIPIAIQLEKESSVKVVPIYLRPFDFSNLEFSKNQMIPKDSEENLRAISQWENMDEAFMEIAKRIREVIDSIS